MKREVDVLIIGGGVIGICCAHFLRRQGRQVVVVERGEVCSGSSHGNAGLIVPSHSVPLAAPGMVLKGLKWMFNPESPFYIKPRLDLELASWLWKFSRASSVKRMHRSINVIRDLSLASVGLYADLADNAGLDFAFEHRGLLTVARSDKALEAVIKEGEMMRTAGLEIETLSAAEVQEKVGPSRIDVAGGVFYAQDAHMVPDRFVKSLAQHVQDQGVEICTQTEVLGFATAGDAVSLVRTTRGDFSAREVVLSSGSWSSALGRDLDLRLPIQPGKGYSVTFKRPAIAPAIPVVMADAKVGLTPMGDWLRFAGTLELAGMDMAVNQRRVQAILRSVPLIMPDLDLDSLELVEVWRGLRPCTPDGLPFLGRSSRHSNLTVAAGHAMIGMSMGPISGKLVADVVTGEAPSLDISALALDRFN